jgi:antitoxin YobK
MAMQDFEEAVLLIQQYPDLISGSVQPQSASRIDEAQTALGVQFPPTYRQFLATFGDLSFGAQEFHGLVGSAPIDAYQSYVVWITRTTVQEGFLPPGMVIVSEDGMGGYYVIDLRAVGTGEEGPVVYWHSGLSKPDDTLEVVAEDFGSFLRQEVEAVIARS